MDAHNTIPLLRPSGAGLWVICEGQPILAVGLPDNNGEADDTIREEGTACHAVALALAHGHTVTEGMTAPNGVVVTEEMLDACALYINALRDWGITVTYEQKIAIDRIYPGLVGTPDGHGYDSVKKLLRVADLKFGYRYVDVFECWQLICYVAGLLDMYGLDDLDTWVELTIVQPRAYGHEAVRTWLVKASDLRAYINTLTNAAHRAMLGHGLLQANPGCLNCVTRFRCVANQTAAFNATSLAVQSVPLELSAAELAAELRLLQNYSKQMEARITGLEAQAAQLVMGGKIVPGFEMVHGLGREAWQSPEKEAEALALGRLMGKNISKDTRALTPTQAKKILPPELVELYSFRPRLEGKIKQVDAKKVRKAFQ